MKSLLRSALGAVTILLLSSCGSSVEFSGAGTPVATGGGDQIVEEPIRPTPPPPPSPFSFVNWYWQCDGKSAPPAGTGDERVVTSSEQLTQDDFDRLVGSTFVFSGQLCPPKEVKRDVVFVIDVSGSMDNLSSIVDPSQRKGNDLLENGSCGRLETVTTIIQQAQNEDIRFGLVTFSSDVAASSTQFYSTLADLETSLGDTLVNVVCAGDGGTHFDKALRAAETMFSDHSRSDAQVREIYLVSDGAPSSADVDGVAEATSLKNSDVRIATALLQGNSDTDPDHLRNKISSVDENGDPLHATVQDAADLANSLAELASNKITRATMKYKPIGKNVEWQEVDLLQHLNGFFFEYEAFTVSLESAPKGLEALFTYDDKYGNMVESKGKLKWKLKSK